MTTRLEAAFAAAAQRPEAEQDLLASRLLAELEAEDDFDRAIAASTDKLASLAAEALAEHRDGLTEDLDPDRLPGRESTSDAAIRNPDGEMSR